MKLHLPALLAALALLPAPPAGRAPPGQEAQRPVRAPTELFEVTRVVDGDTIYIQRGGEIQKLRLLSVDTEEKLSGRASSDTLKPETVFGQETALWAREFFDELAGEGSAARVGLLFPDGEERNDVYGRLLCHVLLPDGRDFNVLLVELGKSPYFNKYGNSRICHERFVAAQERARAERLGIWNPATNRASTPGAPEAVRPYDLLLPWWQARAEAIDAYRAKHAADPAQHVDGEDPEALAAAARLAEPVRVFGSPYRLFDETNGTWTVLFRSPHRDRALRARIPAERREAFADLGLERTLGELEQNYVWVTGRVTDSGRGFEIRLEEPGNWELAGPHPRIPAAAGSEPAGSEPAGSGR